MPSVLYASASWTMTGDSERAVRRTQRKMMRKILGVRRQRLPATQQTVGDSSDEDTDNEAE
eukprot:11147099-Karenia_brevis.AAC.1